ncbi:Sec23/Sec24 trunk domain-containing protein [Pilobolus umbonatus]|nr:Sec23/Sec24 trunk domain-containing protein [Pilobolus umbonatus]
MNPPSRGTPERSISPGDTLHQDRRQRRHYPRIADPSLTSSLSPSAPISQPPSRYGSPLPVNTPTTYQNDYKQVYQGMANMNIQPQAYPQTPYAQPQYQAQTPYAQPQAQTPYAQPQAQTPYAQPQAQTPYAQPQAQTPYAQPHAQPKYAQPIRQEVSLMGQPPVLEDINKEPTQPNLQNCITATGSPTAQVSAQIQQSTVNAMPYSNALAKKTKVPLALVLQPYLGDAQKEEIPLVSDMVVSRCTRCKTYINPFVQFTAGALQWQCNMCGKENEVPQAFDWNIMTHEAANRYDRPELNYGCVDIIAPAEFAIRPPQPPVYVFVVDTSYQAIQTGMIAVVADAIKASLDKIPNEDDRTKIAFITADNAIGFHKLNGGGEPEILVVGDLTDIYLPRASSDLMVNLTECRRSVDDLLDKMKMMYNQTSSPSNCLGSALQAARKLLAPTGGKIVCFQGSIPNLGVGSITEKKEATKSILDLPLTSASNSFYKTFADDCVKTQVCADMFVFGSQWSDLSTLNVVPRFTGGQTHYYPGFSALNQTDCLKLKEEIISLLSEKIGLEAVMRTRCSQGIVCRSFFGNCTTRVPDIMALPNVPRDQSYCVELGIEEDITTPFVYFQTALLYTTCSSERRLRIMNLCLPVARSLSEVFSSANQVAIARVLCHRALDKAVNYKLRDGRDLLAQQCTEIFSQYKKEMASTAATASQLTISQEMNLLPLLVLGLIKSDALNESPLIPVDMRAQSAIFLRTLPTESWKHYVIPHFYPIHSMPPMAGTMDPTGHCVMPPLMNLSSEKMESHGCYLLENGHTIYLWFGKHCIPPLCRDLLGLSSIQEVKSGQIPLLPSQNTPISDRLVHIVHSIQSNRQTAYYPTLHIIREDEDPFLRSRFLGYLIEDRQPSGPSTAGANLTAVHSGMSYYQWLGYIRAKCQ